MLVDDGVLFFMSMMSQLVLGGTARDINGFSLVTIVRGVMSHSYLYNNHS